MKLKSLIFACCFSFFGALFAANQHVHPQAANGGDVKSANKSVSWPGYCEIEIVNQSYEQVRVFGIFDDGSSLPPFNIYMNDAPHYISLYYYGYCHSGMNLYVDTLDGYSVYSGYTPTNTTIRVVPYLTNQVKAEIQAK